jgi:hypothetical protein
MPYSNKFTQSESELKGGNDRRRTSFDDILTLTCICCAKFICQIYELWYLYRWGCNGISYVQWKCVCIWMYSLLYLFCNYQEYSLCCVTVFACSALCIWKAIQPISHLMRGRCLETSSVKIGVQRFLGKDHDVGIL